MRRGPQIVTIKDMAIISAMTGACSGFKVVDAGSGSGFLAAYLGNIVKPEGHVTTYEVRKEHFELVKRNIERAGLSEFITIKNKDFFDGIEEKDLDLITLDMPETFKGIGIAWNALKRGGWLVSYVPSMEQAKEFAINAKKKGFSEIDTFETSLRKILINEKSTRPQNMGLMHTAFIGFARKPRKI